MRPPRILLAALLLAGPGACGDAAEPGRIAPFDPPRTSWELSGTEPAPAGTVAADGPGTAADAAQRGAERYAILCTPCHGAGGAGDGPVAGRYVPAPPRFDEPRLRAADDAHLLAVIADGHGRMYGFADRAGPAERQAILAHLRRLQGAGP